MYLAGAVVGGIRPLAAQHMDAMPIAPLRQSGVSFPSIGHYLRARSQAGLHKRAQTLGGGVSDPRQPNAPDAFAVLLGGDGDQGFLLAASAPWPLGQTPDIRFIHLHFPAQPFPPWSHHRWRSLCSQLQAVRSPPNPNTRCSPSALAPFFLAGDIPHGSEPKPQRLTGVLKNRSGGHGGLMPTSRTDPAVMHGRPSLAPTATRTDKTLRPAQRHEVSATGSVRGKPTLELQDRLGIVLGHALHYRQGQVASNWLAHNFYFGGGLCAALDPSPRRLYTAPDFR